MTQTDKVTELTIQPQKSFSLTPQNLEEAMKFSDMIAKSDICPKDFQGKAGNVLVAIQMGLELGIPPMQALQNIAVINSRPCVWGDALPALAKSHPRFEHIDESFDDKTMTAICKIKRRGEPEQVKTFSQEDAVTAGLWNKAGPWKNYPKRMLQMRARAFAIRDVFPDSLKGIQVVEEVRDYQVIEGETVPPAETRPTLPEQLPEYPLDRFEANLPKWRKAIEDGTKKVEDVIATVGSKYRLSEGQIKKIKGEA